MLLYVLAACNYAVLIIGRKRHWDNVLGCVKILSSSAPARGCNGTGPRFITVTQDQLGVEWPEGMLIPTHLCHLSTCHNFTPLMELPRATASLAGCMSWS